MQAADKRPAIERLRRHPASFLCVFLVLATVLLDLLAGAIASALLEADAGRQPAVAPGGTMLYRYATPYHHDLLPDLDGEARWGGITYAMRSNALGFKSTATGPLPPKGQRQRLLFLGDSLTEGVGVSPEGVFVTRIGELLPDTQTLNAGVTSYAPIIYYRKLRYLLEQQHLEVDAVLVFLDISDIQDEAIYYSWGPSDDVVDNYQRVIYAGKGFNPLTKLPAWDLSTRSRGFWERRTVLIAGLIRAWRTQFDYPPSLLQATGFLRALWTLDDQTWQDYGKLGLGNATSDMQKLADYLRARNIPLTLVIYPWPDQILHGDLESRQVRHWREWSASQGVDFLNLFPLFLAPRSPQALANLYIPGDLHWSAAGHDLVARAFAQHWQEQQRTPPRYSPTR